MYLGDGLPRQKPGSNPFRVLILLALIAVGLYVLTVKPETIPQPFKPTPTPTRTAASHAQEAETYFQEGRLDKAIESYKEALRRDPTIVETYVPLVRLLLFRSQIDEALDYADTALLVDPDHTDARAVRAMALDWKSSELADEGLEGDAEELLLQALNEANRVVEKDPTSAEAYAYLAEILFDLDNYEQADEALEIALELDPDSLDVLRVAGYLLEFRGYRQQAIEHYQKAIQLYPNLAMLHLSLGRTYLAAADFKTGIDSLKAAIELDPDNAEYLYFLGYAYFGTGEQALAADYFQQTLELRPDYAKAHCQLGLIYYRQRNWEGAIPELETAVEIYGDRLSYRNAFCYSTLGLSYFYLARCEEAYPLFDQVLEAIPDDTSSLEGIRLCEEAEAQGAESVTPTP